MLTKIIGGTPEQKTTGDFPPVGQLRMFLTLSVSPAK